MPAMQHAKRKEEFTAQQLIEALGRLHFTQHDLKSLVDLTHSVMDEDFDRRLAELKASRDGAALPLDVLRRQIINDVCPCRQVWRNYERENGNA